MLGSEGEGLSDSEVGVWAGDGGGGNWTFGRGGNDVWGLVGRFADGEVEDDGVGGMMIGDDGWTLECDIFLY